ncbi:MAG: LysR family transcriptional regulator [Armatimonadota bacterium]|nr:LysR family transcriptional regulator [Armatimonadota bacterium]
MNINHLAVFHAVAEEGSVTRAAERLCISQPAVSKQLRELERSLGMALFHRLSKGVRLTEAGELLAGYARRLFDLEAEAERALAELRGLERGRLRVGASTTIGIYLLPEIFAKFRQQYPGIELQLEIANTQEIQRRLIENKLDLGLTEGLVEGEEFQVEVLRWDDIVAIAPPDHPLLSEAELTAEKLCREPIVSREAGSGTRAVVERALREKGLTIHPVMALGSTEAVKRAVAAGVGVALVSRLAVSLELEAGRLAVLPVADLQIHRPLHRLKLRGKYEGRAVREFLRLLRQMVSQIN